jgi:hypothetical protein
MIRDAETDTKLESFMVLIMASVVAALCVVIYSELADSGIS